MKPVALDRTHDMIGCDLCKPADLEVREELGRLMPAM